MSTTNFRELSQCGLKNLCYLDHSVPEVCWATPWHSGAQAVLTPRARQQERWSRPPTPHRSTRASSCAVLSNTQHGGEYCSLLTWLQTEVRLVSSS